MRSRAVVVSVVVQAMLAPLVGCNLILDNEPGRLRSSAIAADASADAASDGAASDGAASDGAGLACGADQKVCEGACVERSEPRYGCDPASCSPCPNVEHAAAQCGAQGCGYSACEANFGDCDEVASNGCEADFSRRETCGSCAIRCSPSQPDCIRRSRTGTYFCGRQ